MVMWWLLAIAAVVNAQCALRGVCGPISRFGNSLPCVANSSEPEPLSDPLGPDSKLLADLCGFKPGTSVCCTSEQVQDLAENLKRVEPLIGSCSACLQNFRDVWCHFTCSPTQNSFLRVDEVQTTLKGKTAPKRVSYFVDKELAANFYDSCKDVKFSATNGNAMNLVGGGAQDYKEFLKFLGDEKPMLGGSTFQIDFPWSDSKNYRRMNDSTQWSCGSGPKKCACIDCSPACPALPPVNEGRCQFMFLGCDTVLKTTLYTALVLVLVWLWLGRLRYNEQNAADEVARLIEADDTNEQIGDDPFSVPSAELGSLNLRTYRLDRAISRTLRRQGAFCARYPSLVCALCALFVLCSSLGLIGMQIETDPFNLWVSSDSREAHERQFFDSEFGGGFYRTAQLFVVDDGGNPVLNSYETLDWLKSVESRVATLNTPVLQDSLDSFCLKPVNGACAVFSVTQYGVRNNLQWRSRLQRCINQPVSCLPRFQQPIEPDLVFGVPANSTSALIDSNALVSTWVLRNSEDPVFRYCVEEWEMLAEEFFRNVVAKEAKERGLRISYNVESSLERELARSGLSDVYIIAISYLIMFGYVSYSLGEAWWVGLAGVLVVMCSVASAVGILSIMGFKLTLIITEVIPFLALAIGVDNIFLICHELALVTETNPELVTPEDQIAAALASVGPSVVLATSCEAAALAIAAAVPMPAVRNFALFALVAVVLNSALQLTFFVAVLAVYKTRQQRIVLPETVVGPITIPPVPEVPDQLGQAAPEPVTSNAPSIHTLSQGPQLSKVGLVFAELTPRLLNRRTKRYICVLFFMWLVASISVLSKMQLGLDQRQAVPTDSFLVPYFSDVYDYLGVGPPTYFVVSGAEMEVREKQQKLCGRFSTCDTNSLVNVLEVERKRPELSWLGSPPASWVDDFFMWLNPMNEQCCIEHDDDDDTQEVCYAHKPWGFDMHGFPQGENFTHYLSKWLAQPSDQCPLAGKAPYGQAISLYDSGKVKATHFRANHRPLRSQTDYIAAYTAARRISDDLSDSLGLNVFPYSIFYAFFAQYLTIRRDSVMLVGSALAATTILAWVLLGSLRTAALLMAVVLSLVINVCGLMYYWDIDLNALSLVNLVICVGLGVEFCIHIVRSFTFVARVRAIGIRGFSKVDRSYNALVGTGGTVFSGVAVTKLLGVCVLAFAHSQIFHVYYFRMWLALIVSATLHSLVLLPVVLSMWGGKAWLVEGESTGLVDLEEDL